MAVPQADATVELARVGFKSSVVVPEPSAARAMESWLLMVVSRLLVPLCEEVMVEFAPLAVLN